VQAFGRMNGIYSAIIRISGIPRSITEGLPQPTIAVCMAYLDAPELAGVECLDATLSLGLIHPPKNESGGGLEATRLPP
jgi:hypothetical protein